MQAGLVVMWVQVLFRDGQFAEGERLAQELIQAHKEVGAIYDVLYAYYRSQNRLPEAENILRAKVNNNPACDQRCDGVSDVLCRRGQTGSAERNFATRA